jgi:hypothetical protein
MSTLELGPFNFSAVMKSIRDLEERLHRFTGALEAAQIPYAVVGGNAVANWVSRINPDAVRFTKDIDILLWRQDVPAVIQAVAPAGFIFRHSAGIDFFRDGEHGRFSSGVHLLMAGEKVRDEDVVPAPDMSESEMAEGYKVISLEALVRMKLVSFRPKDQTHLIDMIELKMIDATWCDRYPTELAERLQQLLNRPDLQNLDELEGE